MSRYPIKMLKDENGVPFVPCTSMHGIVDYEPGTDWSADKNNYYNKEEIDNKINSLFLVCNENDFANLTDTEKENYYIIIVEPMAELTETSTVNLLNILKNDNITNIEVDISEKEAEKITDNIIEGGV